MIIDTALIIDFLKRHLICILITLAGVAAGPWGLAAGFAAGVFTEIIVHRIQEERKIRNQVENGGNLSDCSEPFPGALYACALAVYSLGESSVAAREAEVIFGKKYKADWNTFCRSAAESALLNGDLISEYLASALLKAMGKKQAVPLAEIFKLLQVSEFNWDEKRGEKPSVYLAQLLNYRCDSDELADDYSVLGLKNGASVAEVKKAHRKLAALYHPDTGTEKNDTEFIRVQKAYEKIMDAQ